MSDFFDFTKRIIPATETEFAVISGNSVAYTNFIARTSGLDSTHLNAYAGLLNGLTTDGLFNSDGTSSYLDVLYIFATQSATTAPLNLVSPSFNATLVGSPSFTADHGYSGFSIGAHLESYNASTAGGNYSLNSASMAIWCYDAPSVGCAPIGMSAGGSGENMFPNNAGCLMRVNDNPETGAFILTSAPGLFLGNRSGSTSRQAYKNGVSLGTYVSPPALSALNNDNFSLGWSGNQSASMTSTLSIVEFGGSLNSTLAGNLYNRLSTYMGAV
jgi:hypothetical protein